MMNTPLGTAARVDHSTGMAMSTSKVKKKKNITYRVFFTIWIILILSGIAAAFFYTQLLKQQITSDITHQTNEQLKQVKANYQEQLTLLQTDVQARIGQLEAKVNSLSEQLSFTSDATNTKTDSSNSLYTQLAELRKQLDELKANLDVLK